MTDIVSSVYMCFYHPHIVKYSGWFTTLFLAFKVICELVAQILQALVPCFIWFSVWQFLILNALRQEFFRIQRYGNCVLAKWLREGGSAAQTGKCQENAVLTSLLKGICRLANRWFTTELFIEVGDLSDTGI